MRKPRHDHHEPHDEPVASGRAEAIERYGHDLMPFSEILAKPPEWIIPGLLMPGLNLVIAPPKNYKSFMTFCMVASVMHGMTVGDDKHRKAKRKGPVVLAAPEQGESSIKHIYETRVTRKTWPRSPVSWDFSLLKEPMKWKLDRQGMDYDPHYDLTNFIKVWRPYILILDPLNHFHSMDENDPAIAQILIGPKEAMKKIGGALVVVHHERKRAADENAKAGDWNRGRGSGAIWALADGGVQLNKISGTQKDGQPISVNVFSEFKEHPQEQWTWKVNV